MKKAEQRKFIRDLTRNVRNELLAEVGKIPKNWDGVEIRWWMADRFGQVVFGEVGKRKGRRYRDYVNDCYNHNL